MWGPQILSGAAVWAAAGLLLRGSRFSGADEGAQEFAFDLRGDLIDGDAGFGEEGARVFDVVGAGWLEVDVGEARGGELGAVVVLFERAGDAADPKQHALADGVGDLAVGDDIGDGEAAAGTQHAEGLAQHAVLVAGKIDDAVGEDDVDGVVGERDVFDLTLEELDVGGACLALVFAREGEHVVRHVEAICFTSWPDAAGGQQHVDAAAGAEIEHGLAGAQVDQRGGIAAAERGEDGLFWEFAVLEFAIKVLGDGVAAAHGGVATCCAAGLGYAAGDGTVFLLDCGLGGHERGLFRIRQGKYITSEYICQGVYYFLATEPAIV